MRKLILLPLLLILTISLLSCATFTQGNSGNWTLDIANWTPYQKANFFTSTWMAEKYNYDNLNTMQDKPKELVEVLTAKQKILESSRIPVRLYASTVKGGGIPSDADELAIIQWLRQLQIQYVYGGK